MYQLINQNRVFCILKRTCLLSVFCVATGWMTSYAQNINNPNKTGPLGTQVNTYTGNFFLPRTDFFIEARAFDINVTFYYNSFLFRESSAFGRGWSFHYDIKCIPDTGGTKRIQWGDGREDRYDSLPGNNFKAPRGFYSKLVQPAPGQFILTKPDSTKYIFANAVHRHLTRMEEPNGNFINFIYTDTLLTSLVNSDGQTIGFTYNAAGRLVAMTDMASTPQRSYTYTYDATGNLLEVKDPLNNKQRYNYLVNGPMKTLADKNNNVVDIVYFPDFTTSELIGCNKRISYSYDSASNITVVTDHMAEGNQVTKYSYKKLDNLFWVTSITGNCCGFNVTFDYDDNGNKIRETDANGNSYTYTYDSRGNMLTATDPLGNVNTYTYSTVFNRIASYRDAKGNLYTFSHDAAGNMTELVAPGNKIFAATYNAKGDIVSSTDPAGNKFTYSYDVFGRPGYVSGPGGYTALLQYDTRGNLLAFTDARGNTKTQEYDILDRLKKITDPINNVRQFSYDAEGNIIAMVNENNETATFGYDASNRRVKAVGPTGITGTASYDAMNNITSIKDPLGAETKFSYDTRNRLKRLEDPLGNILTYEHDANGNIVTALLPNGQRVNYTYDKRNRITALKDASGTLAAFTYDANGNIMRYTNASGSTTDFVYDPLNRISKVTDPLGNSREYTYDPNNNVHSVKDRNGFTSYYTYDSMSRIKTFTDNNGFVTAATYDAQGNIATLKDQNNNVTSYTYDHMNRLKRMLYADNRYSELSYDSRGNITGKRQTDGTSITYQYDAMSRMISKTLPDGQVYSYSYDAKGRVITAANNNGVVTLTYDPLDRISSETFEGRTTRYSFNTSGRTQSTTYPDSTVVVKFFDTRGRLVKITSNGSNVVEYVYNNAGQPVEKNFSNGIKTGFQYDFANRLSNISSIGTAMQQSQFTYDKERNRIGITRNDHPERSEQFTYDNNYRLLSYRKGNTLQNTYAYDAVGNRTAANLAGNSITYSTNNLNQLTVSSNASQTINFTFDNRGNLTFDGKYYKSYDPENRLIKDSASPLNVFTYGYDAFNRRIRKNGTAGASHFFYSGLAQIEERDQNNNLLDRTIFSDFLTPVLSEKNNNAYYYHQNDLNSVELVTDAAGRLVERYEYDAYGKPTRYDSLNNVLAVSAAGNRFGFTGQEYDTASGSYRFFYRNYSPETGTFNQRDLIGYEDGMGMYQYLGNNPANGIDVLGLADCGDGWMTWNKFTYTSITLSTVNGVTNYLSPTYLKNVGDPIMTRALLPLNVVGTAKEGYDYVDGFGDRSGGQNLEKGIDLGVSLTGLGAAGVVAVAGSAAAAPVAAAVGTVVVTYKIVDGVSQAVFTYVMDESLAVENAAMLNSYDPAKWREVERLKEEYQRQYREWKEKCPEGGTQKKPEFIDPVTGKTIVLGSYDPNLIIGPEGEPGKHWVSVKDRLPYTILYENDSTASAPAKFVRVTTPIEPKQDANTLELGSFGFNNQTFTVPDHTASYYQRLDCRDSMGLYVDVVAGYDQISNVVFWEFQSIDPVTLVTPEDPLKGFLFLRDSIQQNYGHGFVNFSIRPKQTAVTLDTIGARAQIVFDSNDTIPTNVHLNTIDAFAPTSHMNALPANPVNPLPLSWGGSDDPGGCGIRYYTLYVSADGVNYNIVRSGITRTDTTFTGMPNTTYSFFVLATDSVGNTEILRPGEIKTVTFGTVLPVTWLYFKGVTQDKNNLLDWATASEQNSKHFEIERSVNGIDYRRIGIVAAAGNSSTRSTYRYIDRDIDRLNSNVFFYRLQQVDIDNHARQSNIVRLLYNQTGKSQTIVYPNPTNRMITITVGDEKLVGTMAALYDEAGRLLETFKIQNTSQQLLLDKYMNGVYYIRLSNNETLRVIKQQ